MIIRNINSCYVALFYFYVGVNVYHHGENNRQILAKLHKIMSFLPENEATHMSALL